MSAILSIRPISVIGRFLDILMIPLMYLASGTFSEEPQRTHVWHVQVLRSDEINRLDRNIMVLGAKAIAISRNNRWDLRFHIPILGGWRDYVVLDQKGDGEQWHVGWVLPSHAALSKIPIVGPVRMLLGPQDVLFFAVTSDGRQTPLEVIGKGMVGDGGQYKKLPLL